MQLYYYFHLQILNIHATSWASQYCRSLRTDEIGQAGAAELGNGALLIVKDDQEALLDRCAAAYLQVLIPDTRRKSNLRRILHILQNTQWCSEQGQLLSCCHGLHHGPIHML